MMVVSIPMAMGVFVIMGVAMVIMAMLMTMLMGMTVPLMSMVIQSNFITGATRTETLDGYLVGRFTAAFTHSLVSTWMIGGRALCFLIYIFG